MFNESEQSFDFPIAELDRKKVSSTDANARSDKPLNQNTQTSSSKNTMRLILFDQGADDPLTSSESVRSHQSSNFFEKPNFALNNPLQSEMQQDQEFSILQSENEYHKLQIPLFHRADSFGYESMMQIEQNSQKMISEENDLLKSDGHLSFIKKKGVFSSGIKSVNSKISQNNISGVKSDKKNYSILNSSHQKIVWIPQNGFLDDGLSFSSDKTPVNNLRQNSQKIEGRSQKSTFFGRIFNYCDEPIILRDCSEQAIMENAFERSISSSLSKQEYNGKQAIIDEISCTCKNCKCNSFSCNCKRRNRRCNFRCLCDDQKCRNHHPNSRFQLKLNDQKQIEHNQTQDKSSSETRVNPISFISEQSSDQALKHNYMDFQSPHFHIDN